MASFKLPTDIVLTKGDILNKVALEPLLALLEKYDRKGERIVPAAAAQKADQEARAAWEKAHPEVANGVVQMVSPAGWGLSRINPRGFNEVERVCNEIEP